MLRTHSCADLGPKNISETVTLSGWIHALRDHGGLLFADLRDRSGIIQIVFKKEALKKEAKLLGLEDVIQIKGRVEERPKGTENPELATGTIEINIESLALLNKSKPIPFQIAEKSTEALEETRLRYRHLDLRRPKMQKALRLRHEFTQAIRNFLSLEGFWDIETPLLTKSTPEGSRDFLVPSRLVPGSFYALPQSPQIFKQMLMVSGVEKYCQIARCLRDEDLRADRQPEHTQIDLEMSFVEREDIWALVEKMLSQVVPQVFGIKITTPFERMGYEEAIKNFQSDKPDLRFRDIKRLKLNDVFKETRFNAFQEALSNKKTISALRIPSAKTISRNQLDQSVKLAKELGARGLVWIKTQDKKLDSPIDKHLTDSEKSQLLALSKPGDLLFVLAEETELIDKIFKQLKSRWIEILGLKPQETFSWVWIYDFPLLEYSQEMRRWQATHNPFTAPPPQDLDLLESQPQKCRSLQYDLVLNGVELGSGSIRNHKRETQERIFKRMGYTQEEIQERFGWMLEALDFGAPPHGGIALGLDRLLATFLGEDSIREVIPFPKTQRGTCLFSGAPTRADEKQLKELSIKTLV